MGEPEPPRAGGNEPRHGREINRGRAGVSQPVKTRKRDRNIERKAPMTTRSTPNPNRVTATLGYPNEAVTNAIKIKRSPAAVIRDIPRRRCRTTPPTTAVVTTFVFVLTLMAG